MEPYQYWTISAFILVFVGFLTSGNLLLVISGALFTGAVIAFKFPDLYILQLGTALFVAPMFYNALNKNKKLQKGGKNGNR